MVRDTGYSQSAPSHGGGAGVPAAAAQPANACAELAQATAACTRLTKNAWQQTESAQQHAHANSTFPEIACFF